MWSVRLPSAHTPLQRPSDVSCSVHNVIAVTVEGSGNTYNFAIVNPCDPTHPILVTTTHASPLVALCFPKYGTAHDLLSVDSSGRCILWGMQRRCLSVWQPIAEMELRIQPLVVRSLYFGNMILRRVNECDEAPPMASYVSPNPIRFSGSSFLCPLVAYVVVGSTSVFLLWKDTSSTRVNMLPVALSDHTILVADACLLSGGFLAVAFQDESHASHEFQVFSYSVTLNPDHESMMCEFQSFVRVVDHCEGSTLSSLSLTAVGTDLHCLVESCDSSNDGTLTLLNINFLEGTASLRSSAQVPVTGCAIPSVPGTQRRSVGKIVVSPEGYQVAILPHLDNEPVRILNGISLQCVATLPLPADGSSSGEPPLKRANVKTQEEAPDSLQGEQPHSTNGSLCFSHNGAAIVVLDASSFCHWFPAMLFEEPEELLSTAANMVMHCVWKPAGDAFDIASLFLHWPDLDPSLWESFFGNLPVFQDGSLYKQRLDVIVSQLLRLFPSTSAHSLEHTLNLLEEHSYLSFSRKFNVSFHSDGSLPDGEVTQGKALRFCMALDRLCSFVLLRWFSMIHLDIVLRKESTEHVSVPDPMVMTSEMLFNPRKVGRILSLLYFLKKHTQVLQYLRQLSRDYKPSSLLTLLRLMVYIPKFDELLAGALASLRSDAETTVPSWCLQEHHHTWQPLALPWCGPMLRSLQSIHQFSIPEIPEFVKHLASVRSSRGEGALLVDTCVSTPLSKLSVLDLPHVEESLFDWGIGDCIRDVISGDALAAIVASPPSASSPTLLACSRCFRLTKHISDSESPPSCPLCGAFWQLWK